jgi:hypothetical protein
MDIVDIMDNGYNGYNGGTIYQSIFILIYIYINYGYL